MVYGMFWLDRIIFILLCLLIFVLPASKGGATLFAALSIVLFLAKKVFLLFSRHAGQAQANPITPVFSLSVAMPIGLYILVNLISIFFSWDSALSFKGFIGKILQLVLLFVVMAETLSTSRRVFQFLMCFLVSAFILSMDGLWQFFSGWDIFKHNTLIQDRVRASMYHPNDLGAYLIVALPLVLFFASFAWRQWRKNKTRHDGMLFLGGLVCSAAVSVVLVLTYSRSAWVGLLFGVALWAVIRRSWRIFATFLFMLVFLLTPLVVSKRNLPESTIFQQSNGMVQDDRTALDGEGVCGRFLGILNRGLSTSDRIHYWEAAVKIIKDHPWTGTGLNTYVQVVKEYAPQYPFYAHNTLLQVAAELGLPGLVIVIWMLLAPLIFALRRIRDIKDPLWGGVLGAVAAGYFAILAESTLDTTFYSVQLSMLIWSLMALLVVIPKAYKPK